MATLHDLRQQVITAVGAVSVGSAIVQTYDHVPARLVPPALIVLPGSPYIEPGDVFGTFTVHHTVSVVMATGTNESVTQGIDDVLEAVLLALLAADVSIESVSTFYAFDANSVQYLAADITVSDTVRL